MKYNLAFTHDYLTSIGGAEMTLKALTEIWPQSPVYTLLHDPGKINAQFLPGPAPQVSFLQKLPRSLRRRRKYLLPLLAVAPETFDLRDYQVVLSSSGAFSKGIITKPSTLNLCYCHSPARFLWDYSSEYLAEQKTSRLTNMAARLVVNYLRLWDQSAAKRPDYLIANSRATQHQLKKYYRRSATVIYPPVETHLFQAGSLNQAGKKQMRFASATDYFLIVSRLSPYKKIDVAVEAFNKLGWKLAVIGEGPEFQKLKNLAGPTVKILGFKDRAKTIQYFKNCCGYIQAGEEDFGISAVEAMAAGKPVLALKAGGALETVVEGQTGEFFASPTVEVLAQGAYRLKNNLAQYDPQKIQAHARQFSKERFQQEIKDYVSRQYSRFVGKSQ